MKGKTSSIGIPGAINGRRTVERWKTQARRNTGPASSWGRLTIEEQNRIIARQLRWIAFCGAVALAAGLTYLALTN